MHDKIYYLLRTSHVIIRSALWFHASILVFWVCLSIVKGFCMYDAVPPASFHAISHIGFWVAIEIFVITIGFMSVSFDLSTFRDGFALSVKRTIELMTFWTILLVFAIIANIIHLVAASLELSDCRTTLCMLNSGFLITLIVILGCLILLEILEIYIVYVYKKRLRVSNELILKVR